jgi:hypothetical protein
MTRTCACGQPLHDQEEACRDCVKHTRRRLAKQPELAHELEITVTRQARMEEANDGGRSAETPVPFVPLAASVMHQQRATLVAWCRLIAEEGIGPLPEGESIGALAAHIGIHLPTLRNHAAAPELVAEIKHVTEKAIAAVDLPKNRLQFIAGECPEQYDGWCAGHVIITVPRDESAGRSMAACTACRMEWDPTQWLRLGHRIEQRRQAEDRQRNLAQSFRRAS